MNADKTKAELVDHRRQSLGAYGNLIWIVNRDFGFAIEGTLSLNDKNELDGRCAQAVASDAGCETPVR